MKKGKLGLCAAFFSVEVKRPNRRVVPSPSIAEMSPLRRSRSRWSLSTGYRTAIAAQTVLLAALIATGAGEALAGKGGRGQYPNGIPNVNLELAQFQKAGQGVGPFVPAISGASASTPANGLLSRGSHSSPGPRLGHQPQGPEPKSEANRPGLHRTFPTCR